MLINRPARWLLPCLLAAVAAAHAGVADNDPVGRRLEAHVDFLADDLLRGRQAGSDGYDIAANYVVSQYRQMGLRPAGGNGRYRQQVPMRAARLVAGSAGMSVSRDGRTTRLKFLEQFFMPPNLTHTVSDVEAPMVFVGYGIEAPELGYDDYADIDVRGKVVVFLAGQPAAFSTEQGIRFGGIRERSAAAARHGARGMVIIHTPRADQGSPWQRFRQHAGMPAMAWLTDRGSPHASFARLEAIAYVHYDAAGVLFDETPRDLQRLLILDERGQALPVFDLYGRLRLKQRSRHRVVSSPNVVGLLEGSDPHKAGEYVLYTAHLDHLGVAPRAADGAQAGNRIYNGALDNAAGVAVMLETARLFTQGPAPKRSLLFVAVTAEEKGLVGSDYFANNPTVPAGSIVADINIDMPLLLYDFGDVIAYGSEYSSLGSAVGRAAAEAGVAVTPDPYPEKNLFIRSDHYSFVMQGIPSVFLVTGVTRRGGGDSRAIYEQFLKAHYHQPSDQPDLPIDYAAGARFTRINKRIGEIIANQEQEPRWRQGDSFSRVQPP